MTAVAVTPSRAGLSSSVESIVKVVRIHALNRVQLVGWPWLILTLAFVVNLAVFTAIGPTGRPDNVTGAIVSIYFAVAAAHLQSITQLFPFALGISVSRRAFYVGTLAVVCLQALVFGLALTLLCQVETLTGGWGLRLRFFGAGVLAQPDFFAQWAAYTVPFLAIAAVFVVGGVVFKRWGQPGIWVASFGTGLLVAAASTLITVQRWWPAVGQFLAGRSALGLIAGYPLVLAAAFGVLGYLLIRRATP